MSQPSLHGAVDLSSLANPASAPGAAASDGTVIDLTEANLGEAVERSSSVPVLVVVTTAQVPQRDAFLRELETLVGEYAGRLQLGRVDADTAPQIAAALQVSEVPAVLALVGGRPMALFTGIYPADQVRPVLDELLRAAAESGVTGTLEGAEPGDEPAEPPLPPLHAEAYAAIERGDLDAAATAYRRAIRENPRDSDAVAGLAQVELAMRLPTAGAEEILAAADAAPEDVDAQLAAADLEVAAGSVRAGFDRLLAVVRATSGEERDRVRERLVSLFEIVGSGDPEVARARRNLASALY